MLYELATKSESHDIYKIVQKTIKTIYPKYYPSEVVNFFCELHNEDAITNDITNGNVGIIRENGEIVGSGCLIENHITRLYVLPKYQKKGYGTFIMKTLEEKVAKTYNKICLDASLPAVTLYESLGFHTVKHEKYQVENDCALVYEIMEKEFHIVKTKINYNNKRFIPKMNSANGEVSEQTVFTYHQNENLLWAEYSGGDILKGTLIGTVAQNGELDFVYEHINHDMQIKTGKCHSVPTVLDNMKIELSEKWKWTNGDCSTGESLLIEI